MNQVNRVDTEGYIRVHKSTLGLLVVVAFFAGSVTYAVLFTDFMERLGSQPVCEEHK